MHHGRGYGDPVAMVGGGGEGRGRGVKANIHVHVATCRLYGNWDVVHKKMPRRCRYAPLVVVSD